MTLSLRHCLVEIICHVHPLEVFSEKYRQFPGGVSISLPGALSARIAVRSQLTWKTRWQQSSIMLHRKRNQHLLQGTSMYTAVKTCCFMTGTFCLFSSLALSFHPTTANLLLPIIRLPVPSAWPHTVLHVFSVQWSHLSTPRTHICITVQSSQVLLEIEIYGTCGSFLTFFFLAWSSCKETDEEFIVLIIHLDYLLISGSVRFKVTICCLSVKQHSKALIFYTEPPASRLLF